MLRTARVHFVRWLALVRACTGGCDHEWHEDNNSPNVRRHSCDLVLGTTCWAAGSIFGVHTHQATRRERVHTAVTARPGRWLILRQILQEHIRVWSRNGGAIPASVVRAMAAVQSLHSACGIIALPVFERMTFSFALLRMGGLTRRQFRTVLSWVLGHEFAPPLDSPPAASAYHRALRSKCSNDTNM